MGMVDKQDKFSGMTARLIIYAQSLGYQITYGDAYRSPEVKYGHENSTHRVRLAVDLNLFRDGRYLTTTEDHKPLGEYWQRMGGSWGGEFDDANHYSLKHKGVV